MHRVVTFLRLPSDRALAIRAAGRLIATRIALWTQSFARVQEQVGGGRGTVGTAPGRLSGAVETAARSIPKTSCLTQTLAAQVMLERADEHPVLKIGVATGMGSFEAHAWLELHGHPLVGDHELDRYARLG